MCEQLVGFIATFVGILIVLGFAYLVGVIAEKFGISRR